MSFIVELRVGGLSKLGDWGIVTGNNLRNFHRYTNAKVCGYPGMVFQAVSRLGNKLQDYRPE